jgi:hypothetical protein
MTYYFDQWGWLTAEVLPGRTTEVVPPENTPEGKAANWTGHAWVVINYSAPPVSTPEPVSRIFTQVEWLRRFTSTERINIRAAAAVNPVLDDYIRLMDATPEIHADDPDTIGGVQTLEAVGLLATGRAEEILNG